MQTVKPIHCACVSSEPMAFPPTNQSESFEDDNKLGVNHRLFYVASKQVDRGLEEEPGGGWSHDLSVSKRRDT